MKMEKNEKVFFEWMNENDDDGYEYYFKLNYIWCWKKEEISFFLSLYFIF